MKIYTLLEAVTIIIENKDEAAVKELATAYPSFVVAVAKDDMKGVAALVKEKYSVNRLLGAAPDESEDIPEEKATVKKETVEKAGKALEDMSVKELIALCDSRGIKVVKAGRNKQYYIDKILKEDAAEANTEEAEAEEEIWEDEVTTDPYEGKTAKELHAMCKERGIKADIRKPAAFYLGLLKKDDEKKAAEAEELIDGDDWGEEEKPVKGNSKVVKVGKGKKEPEKKDPVYEADDWDI